MAAWQPVQLTFASSTAAIAQHQSRLNSAYRLLYARRGRSCSKYAVAISENLLHDFDQCCRDGVRQVGHQGSFWLLQILPREAALT
jgi:hypothetical protein